jgi:hypothetical protein
MDVNRSFALENDKHPIQRTQLSQQVTNSWEVKPRVLSGKSKPFQLVHKVVKT